MITGSLIPCSDISWVDRLWRSSEEKESRGLSSMSHCTRGHKLDILEMRLCSVQSNNIKPFSALFRLKDHLCITIRQVFQLSKASLDEWSAAYTARWILAYIGSESEVTHSWWAQNTAADSREAKGQLSDAYNGFAFTPCTLCQLLSTVPPSSTPWPNRLPQTKLNS